MRTKFFIFMLTGCSLLFVGCSGGSDPVDEPEVNQQASLSTPVVSNVTYESAELTTTLTPSSTSVIKKGFCYSNSNSLPSISDATLEVRGTSLSAILTALQPETTYYVRAFAMLSGGTVYSSATQFTTSAKSLSDELANYVAPTYPDNYLGVAGWEQHASWNLANVHDPTVMRADDGYYYMYQTDASYGNAHDGHGHFHARRSKNLVDWEYLGATMPSLPAWVNEKLNEIRAAMGLGAVNPSDSEYGYWAPCARKVKTGLYRMYYSLVVPGYIDGDKTSSWGERAFIGVMETSDPASNSWTDKGYVITNASDKGLNFHLNSEDWANAYYRWNAIDPTYIIDNDGKHWLIYGSWHSGIVALEVDAETGKPLNELGQPWGDSVKDIASYGTCIYTREMGNRWQGSEGPELVYHDGYYYLFLAYDNLAVPYNTRVVRASKITGPYYAINGVDCTTNGGDAYPIVTHPYKFSGDQGWVGISHCAIFEDGNGNWYYASQGRFPEGVSGVNASNAIMMGHVRSLRWTEDGWPIVMPERYGAVPQVAISESELIGSWEHIVLQYTLSQQCTSVSLSLGSDHKVTSGWNQGATWSFDATHNVLTIGSLKLYLQREVDWEATPRHATIVYAGYDTYATNDTRKTYWGKKI